MLFTAISVPWILGPKPFILKSQHAKKKAAKEARRKELEDAGEVYIEEEDDDGHGHGHGGEFEFGEVMIHQIIETIEYVLGTVSHTASYLRIWALSLAHQQLSLVFFSKTIQNGMAIENPITAGIA